MYQFTFVVAYRHGPFRLNNLRKVLSWMKSFNGVEIIVVEQDINSKLEDVVLPGKYYFTKSELPFNKAWAFNVGLKNSTTDIVVYGDCDLIMHPEDFIGALNKLNEFESVSPYSRIGVIDLERHELGYSFEQLKEIKRPGRGELEGDIRKVPLCGGIMMYRKDALMRIGGWDESFIGWGGEDNFQSVKTERLTKWTELPHRVYHLWHPPATPDNTFYQRNLNLLNQMSAMDDNNLSAYASSTRRKIGKDHKYEFTD